MRLLRKKFTIEEFIKKIDEFGGNPNKSELMKGVISGATNYHHTTLMTDSVTKKNYVANIKFPVLLTSNIVCLVDDKSGKQSFYIYPEIYGSWPIGKERGQDPEGDSVMDFLEKQDEYYAKSMDTNCSNIKEDIYFGTKQDLSKGVPKCRDKLKSLIKWPVYDENHEKKGQVDPTKSPSFSIKLWDQDVQPDEQISSESLLVNQGRQKIYTNIFDRTTNFNTDDHIKNEQEFLNFTYTKGDSQYNSKPPFKLLVEIEILNPSYYWQQEKTGVVQLKAARINIMQKIIIKRAPQMSESDKQELMKKTLLAQQKYLKNNDFIEEEDDSSNIIINQTQTTETDLLFNDNGHSHGGNSSDSDDDGRRFKKVKSY